MDVFLSINKMMRLHMLPHAETLKIELGISCDPASEQKQVR
jgi:hypothetical protein